jgi:hypothetical protein
MQHSAVFGDIDLFAAKHRVDPRAQTAFFRQLQQKLQRFIGDAIFRIIEVKANCFQRQTFTALGIVGEELAQM